MLGFTGTSVMSRPCQVSHLWISFQAWSKSALLTPPFVLHECEQYPARILLIALTNGLQTPGTQPSQQQPALPC